MLGLPLALFTQLHTIISLVAIAAGLVFFASLGAGRWRGAVNGVFLAFTVLTTVTGFLFPLTGVTPAVIFGVISTVLLAAALYALLGAGLAGPWRRIYLGTALVAQWLNMVVLVVQSFQKIPALNALAPQGNEPPVLAGQALMAAIAVWFAWKAVWKSAAEPAAVPA